MTDTYAFATQYTAAWCSQDAASVAAHFATGGSLTINGGAPAVGRAAITASAQSFMSAFPDLVVTMDGLDIEDGTTVYRWTLTGTNDGPGGTGRRVRISGSERWTFDPNGLVVDSIGQFDATDYQRQLGGGSVNFVLADGIAVLERTPATFRALLAGLPDRWISTNEGPDTFSPFDNVGHLIHGERTDWIPRARIILAQGTDRRFETYDRFAQVRESRGKSLAQLLDEFAELRAENLVVLRDWNLTDRQLALEGEHPELGTVSLRQLLATWVAHDLGHVAQTTRVMAKQFREAVGPWRKYLPVMDR